MDELKRGNFFKLRKLYAPRRSEADDIHAKVRPLEGGATLFYNLLFRSSSVETDFSAFNEIHDKGRCEISYREAQLGIIRPSRIYLIYERRL